MRSLRLWALLAVAVLAAFGATVASARASPLADEENTLSFIVDRSRPEGCVVSSPCTECSASEIEREDSCGLTGMRLTLTCRRREHGGPNVTTPSGMVVVSYTIYEACGGRLSVDMFGFIALMFVISVFSLWFVRVRRRMHAEKLAAIVRG